MAQYKGVRRKLKMVKGQEDPDFNALEQLNER